MRQIISFNNKNVILPEPWVPSGPANDEIWYTSSDGNIVTPNDATALPTIVSNTYSGDKGIIKCASDITSIGKKAFYNCNKFTSVTIPNSVKSIGKLAFRSCYGLTSVSIGNSVTSIGDQSFEVCLNLSSIIYIGTISKWNSISKGTSWNNGVPATVVHCSDGDTAV